MATELPPFPVDDATLDLLEAAMNPREHGDPDAVSSSVWPLLQFMSQMGGSDSAVIEYEVDGVTRLAHPQYHDHDVIAALIAEVRRLRAQGWRAAASALRQARDEQSSWVWFELGEAALTKAADYLDTLEPTDGR
jgi:hypothetical protein